LYLSDRLVVGIEDSEPAVDIDIAVERIDSGSVAVVVVVVVVAVAAAAAAAAVAVAAVEGKDCS
jgi:hypothetical protein